MAISSHFSVFFQLNYVIQKSGQLPILQTEQFLKILYSAK